MENPTLSPLVPQVLMEEILLRLPVKSLLRFKCTSKSWLSLISNPQFAKLHYDLAAAPTHRLLVVGTGDHVESIDVDATPLSDDSTRVCFRFPPPIRPFGIIQFFGSCTCRGFVFFNNFPVSMRDSIVWNPSTGVHRRIPDPGYDFSKLLYFLCGFGYDASKDDYLIILIKYDDDEDAFPTQTSQRSMIKLFSLKTNSWDCIYVDISRFRLSLLDKYFDNIAGLFLEGALHWLVFSRDRNCVAILAFDLVERRLYDIPLPHVLSHRLEYWERGLRVIGGCLGVWCINNHERGTSRGEMWMMKEYQVLSSWSRSFCFGDHQLSSLDFSPIFLTKDNALLGSSNHDANVSLYKFCGETNQWLNDHVTFGDRPGRSFIFNMHSALYRETLLPLP